MGILDDAIREHLDLKRRHGADPAEIERAEREALGPVRREPEPLDGQRLDEPAARPGEPSYYEEDVVDEDLDYDYAVEDEFDGEDEREEGEAFDSPSPHGDPLADDAASLPPERPGGARRPSEAPPLEPEDFLGQETVEYGVPGVEHAPEHPSTERGDMLEETPEFLHDAPDHDRLWFEQKPPRDFDFDG